MQKYICLHYILYIMQNLIVLREIKICNVQIIWAKSFTWTGLQIALSDSLVYLTNLIAAALI